MGRKKTKSEDDLVIVGKDGEYERRDHEIEFEINPQHHMVCK